MSEPAKKRSASGGGRRVAKQAKKNKLVKLVFDDLQSGDADTVSDAAFDLAKHLEEGRTDFVALEGGGHSLLAAAMKWEDNENIMANLTFCVDQLAFEDWAGDSEISEIFLTGGMDLCVGAMVKFPHNKSIQRNVVEALVDFCCNDQCCKERAEYVVNQLGGLALALTAMKAFPKCVELQENGCWFLHELCRHGFRNHALMKEEALGVVALAVKNFKGNVEFDGYDHAHSFKNMLS